MARIRILRKACLIISLKAMILSQIILIFQDHAQAAIYYVDQGHPMANDLNLGTKDSPWKTMIHGCAQVKAGDTLFIRNGVYSSIARPEWYIPGIRVANSGTESQPIIIKAYPGEQPIIDGQTAKHGTIGGHKVSHVILDGLQVSKGLIFFNESSNISVINCTLVEGFTKPTDPSYTNMLEFRYSKFGIVRNNLIYGNRSSSSNTGSNKAAIILHWADDILIENNLFYDNIISYRNKCGDNQAQGHRNIFRYNIIKSCYIGVYMGGYEGASTDNRIEQNIFLDTNVGIGINIGNIRLIIANNVFYSDPLFKPSGDPTTGIGYGGEGAYLSNPDHQIYNNIFVNLQSPISNHTDSFQWPPRFYIDYNLYYNYSAFDQYWTNLTFDQFKLRTTGDTNSIINKDPNFLGPPEDFHLQADSPAKGRGKSGLNMGIYINGDERIGPLPLSVPMKPPQRLRFKP